METWRQDLAHGFRVLAKSRSFTLVAVLSLAIGIGANTAIFSIANALLLKPLPYADEERLTILWQRSPGLDVPQDWFSLGQYDDIRSGNTVFEGTAAAIGASFNLTGIGAPERVDGVRVSSSFFALIGVRAGLGRVFAKDDDQPGKTTVAILANAFWRRRFGADSSIIGHTVTLNGTALTIVGVMSERFSLSNEVMPAVNAIRRADILLPIPMPASIHSARGGEDFVVYAKLKRGVTVDRAQRDMDRIAEQMKREFPGNYPPQGGLTISVVPLIDQVVGDTRLALYVLLAAVAFVLLIACGNVANLSLSRAAAREKELAIRSAIGADRRRLVRQLLTESVLLAVMGGAVGLLVAVGAIETVRRAGPANIPRLADVSIDGQVLAFTVLISLATGVIFGLAPAMRASRVDPNSSLKAGSTPDLRSGRLRKTLVVVEVALSLVLLIGAGLLIGSYERITAANPGFDPRNVLSMRLSLPVAQYPTADAVTSFYRQLGERVKGLPGVQAVGSNYSLPLSSVSLAWEPIRIEGYVPRAGANDLVIASSADIGGDYFDAMGMTLAAGRNFAAGDDPKSTPVVIVNDKLARQFWPNESALGKRLRQGANGPWRTVVGVVRDAKEYDPGKSPPIAIFLPAEQSRLGSRFLVVKSAVDPIGLTDAILREIRTLDPDLPAYDMSTMDQRLSDSLARRRLSMGLLATFAAVALILAAIGIYGVIAYWVTQRTREIGIRVVLGADRAAILRLVIGEFGVMIASGLALGLVAALALTRAMGGLLFGVSATDIRTYGLLSLVLGAVALIATYLPARRALAVEPIVAVRAEG